VAGDQVKLVLAAPEAEFAYRPMVVAEPFAMGSARRVALSRFATDAGAELVRDAVAGVDDPAGELRLQGGGSVRFHALVLAPGARAAAGVEGAVTWWPGGILRSTAVCSVT
jgi:sulfide:quinone oxidoreductase